MADFKSQSVHEIHGYKYDSCEDVLGQVGARSFVFPPGGGVLPYIGYTGMCRWKGYDFQVI